MTLSNYGKLYTANTEFEKGVAFLASAAFLKKNAISEPQQYVALHLFAQGIELILKGALYGKNYDLHKKNGRRIGHRLDKLYNLAEQEFGFRPLSPQASEQLTMLSNLYYNHVLRYAGIQDIFISPASIDVSLVEQKVQPALRLGRREFRKALAADK